MAFQLLHVEQIAKRYERGKNRLCRSFYCEGVQIVLWQEVHQSMLGKKWLKPLLDTTFSTANDTLEAEPTKWIAGSACSNLKPGFMVLCVFHQYCIVLSLGRLFMLLCVFCVKKYCALSSPVIRDGVLSHLSTVLGSWFSEGQKWCTYC